MIEWDGFLLIGTGKKGESRELIVEERGGRLAQADFSHAGSPSSWDNFPALPESSSSFSSTSSSVVTPVHFFSRRFCALIALRLCI